MMYCKCRRHLSFDILLFLAICIGGNTPLWAQSRLDSIQQLDEVVVTAKSYKEVIPAQKMDKLTLQSLNSFSVADAIRYFSGIQIKDYGGIGGLKTVNIRSLGTHHVGIFYDGIQLGNAETDRWIWVNSHWRTWKKSRFTTGRRAKFSNRPRTSVLQARCTCVRARHNSPRERSII